MDDPAERLDRAAAAFRALRPLVEAGEPWPLSTAYGTEPESSWGPKETLAHVDEMVPYWLGQVDRILASPGPAAAPFGRVASNADRIGRIGRDRMLPAAALFERFEAEVATASQRLRGLSAADADRLGRHEARGEMTVAEIVERFVIGHLEEHARQLSEVLEATASPG
jgi:hypothetical protein